MFYSIYFSHILPDIQQILSYYSSFNVNVGIANFQNICSTAWLLKYYIAPSIHDFSGKIQKKW